MAVEPAAGVRHALTWEAARPGRGTLDGRELPRPLHQRLPRPRVRPAAAPRPPTRRPARYGFGARAARAARRRHRGAPPRLEHELAELKGDGGGAASSRSGFACNVGVIARARAEGRRDLQRRAQPRQHRRRVPRERRRRPPVYGHGEVDAPRRRARPAVRRLPRGSLVTDAVFSMDGDVAPVREIVALAEAHDAHGDPRRGARHRRAGRDRGRRGRAVRAHTAASAC